MKTIARHEIAPRSWWQALALERREMLRLLAVAGLTATLPRRGEAAASEIVVSNWGGSAEEAVKTAFTDLCLAATGRSIAVDGSGPLPGKIKAMVEAHQVIWDVADLGFGDIAELGRAGLLEPIDYAIVDRSQVLPGLATEWGLGNYLFSYIFAVNEAKLKGPSPKTWADFFNLKDFPGRRALPGSLSHGVWEAALMADGVASDELYPIDVDRALAKIKTIKAETVFWKSGAQSEDLLREGEVLASLMWSNRAVVVRRQQKQINWTWDRAILSASSWGVPKGNPAGREAVMKFLQISTDPKAQAKVFEIVAMSPSNPAGSAQIPPAEQASNATAYASQQVMINDDWYSANGDASHARYLEVISS